MPYSKKTSEIRKEILLSNEEIHKELGALRQEINVIVVMLADKEDQVADLTERNHQASELLAHYSNVIAGLASVIRDPDKYMDGETRFFTPAYYHDHLSNYPDGTSVLTLTGDLTSIKDLVLDFCQDQQAIAVRWKADTVKVFLHGVKPLAREQITALLSEWNHEIIAQHRLKINDLDLR